MTNLPSIRTLSLNRNAIIDVTPISSLNSLLLLELKNNSIEQGVIELGQLQNLTAVRMEGNGKVSCFTYLELLTMVPVSFNECLFVLPAGEEEEAVVVSSSYQELLEAGYTADQAVAF